MPSKISDERKEEIRRLYIDEQMSQAQIARLLGTTKNAIVGIVSRMELKRSSETNRLVRRRETKAGMARYRAAHGKLWMKPPKITKPNEYAMEKPPLRYPSDEVKVTASVHILDITNDTCRWPIGETWQHIFCGAPVQLKSKMPAVYCEEHNTMAYLEERSR